MVMHKGSPKSARSSTMAVRVLSPACLEYSTVPCDRGNDTVVAGLRQQQRRYWTILCQSGNPYGNGRVIPEGLA